MRTKIESYIRDWEYKCYYNGIPDEVPTEINHLVPSYKKIAIAILKNDNSLQTLGFTPKKSKYYHQLKRIELDERNKPSQLKLF